MSLTILAIGDLHIQPNTLADINVFLSQLDKWLSKNPVDMIVILGDTLHTHETVYTECLNKMLEYLAVCEKYAHTEVLVGNHDYCNNQAFLNDSHPFVGWKKTHNIVDRVKMVKMKDKKIVLSPYVPDGRFGEALRTLSSDWKSADCIFAHQTFDGVKMGPIIATGVEKWDENFPMLVSGHIHDKQLVQPNLWYAGSSMQISFGERDDNTISLITLEEGGECGECSIEEIDINPPKKKTLYVDISNVSELKIPVEENVKVKVSISGDQEEFKTFKKSIEYKKLIGSGVKVVFKQRKNVLNHATFVNSTTTAVVDKRAFPDILYSLIENDLEMIKIYHSVLGYQGADIVFE